MADVFTVVFAIFPRVTQLDFTGPYEVFLRLPGAKIVVASSTGGEVEADGGLTFSRVAKLSDIPACDLICIPGGGGINAAIEDEVFVREVRRLADSARYVTSACTGAFGLGAAGLLRGKRAATHWAWRYLLPKFGAIPDDARVVRAGMTITGGGVTAGIDMALAAVAEIAGVEHAKATQLMIEYAPAPPFDSGRPELASKEVLAMAMERFDPGRKAREEAVARAAARMPD